MLEGWIGWSGWGLFARVGRGGEGQFDPRGSCGGHCDAVDEG